MMFRVYRATVIRHASKMTVSGRKLSAQHFCAVVVEVHMRTEGGLVVSYLAIEAVDELGNTINRTEVHGDGGDDDAEEPPSKKCRSSQQSGRRQRRLNDTVPVMM